MVVNAFFRDDYAAYEAANSNAMYAYFNGQARTQAAVVFRL